MKERKTVVKERSFYCHHGTGWTAWRWACSFVDGEIWMSPSFSSREAAEKDLEQFIAQRKDNDA